MTGTTTAARQFAMPQGISGGGFRIERPGTNTVAFRRWGIVVDRKAIGREVDYRAPYGLKQKTGRPTKARC